MEEAALSGYLVPTSHTPRKAAAAQGEGDSAKAAQRAYHNVHRFVLLMQLQQVGHRQGLCMPCHDEA